VLFVAFFLDVPENTCTNLPIIRHKLCEQFNLEEDSISLRTIKKIVRRAGFKRKRTKFVMEKRNAKVTIDYRQLSVIDLLNYLYQKKTFVFIDECTFKTRLRPIYGYSRIGKSCYVEGPVIGDKINLLAAVTKEKIIGFQLIRQNINGQTFGAFLIGIINANKEIKDHLNDYVFVLDRASYHRAVILRRLFSHLHIHYNASYSPFLNPIEECFSLWKYKVRKALVDSVDQLTDAIIHTSTLIEYKHLYKFYWHSLKLMKSALDKKPIE